MLEEGLASDYFMKHEEKKEELETLLAEFAGGKVEVDFQAVKGPEEFQASYVDLSKIILTEIEEES